MHPGYGKPLMGTVRECADSPEYLGEIAGPAKGPPPARVLIVTGSWSFAGGAEPLLYELVRRLDRRRFAPAVCTVFGDGRGGYAELARQDGIPVWRLAMRWRRPWPLVRSFFRLVRLLRRERVMVVHGWQDRGVGVLAGVLAGTGVRLQTIHALDPDERTAQRVVDRLTINRLATRTVAVSLVLAEALRERHGTRRRRLAVLHNGAAEARIRGGEALERERLGIAAGAPVVLFAGRLSREKGADIAIEAFARLVRGRTDARLVLIGDGPERPALENLARSRGVAERVVFAGYQAEPGPWYRLADMVVMPSRWEALGMTAVEAMAAGLPVVASKIGGLREVVIEGETGLLPEPSTWQSHARNLDPGPFAAALRGLLDGPERARAMGAAGRKRYQSRFTIEAYVSRYEALYARLLHGSYS